MNWVEIILIGGIFIFCLIGGFTFFMKFLQETTKGDGKNG